MIGDPAWQMRPLLGQTQTAQQPTPPGWLPRRRMLAAVGGSVGVAALAALTIGVPASGAVISTTRGEVRLVLLPDGSTMLLNTGTTVRIGYDDRRRWVELLNGEAFFSVTADRSRLFVVEVGDYGSCPPSRSSAAVSS